MVHYCCISEFNSTLGDDVATSNINAGTLTTLIANAGGGDNASEGSALLTGDTVTAGTPTGSIGTGILNMAGNGYETVTSLILDAEVPLSSEDEGVNLSKSYNVCACIYDLSNYK